MKRYYSGFTLVELMVTVTIISVLAGIAYPSYMQSIRKSNRAEAKTDMMDAAQRMQRCYTTYGRFDNPPSGASSCKVYLELTTGSNKIVTRGSGYYEITIGTPATTRTEFTLTAVPTAGKVQTKDTDCAKFTLNQKGEKKAYSSTGTDNSTLCW